MPLTPTTSPRLRQQSLTTDCALGRQEQMTAQAGKGCLGQGVQTLLLAFFLSAYMGLRDLGSPQAGLRACTALV